MKYVHPLYAALAQADTITDPIVRAKIRGLLRGYDARWSSSDLITEAVEDVAESGLWNPETSAQSRSFRVMGKIDWRGRRQGRSVLMDHKTCSEDIADPNAPYWRQLIVEGQLSHYMLLEWLNGRKVDEAVWDVVRKPQISPKKLSKAEVNAVLESRHYSGPLHGPLTELTTEGRETLEMYENRVAFDCTFDRPQHYFQRRTIPRLDAEIHEYAVELWGHGQDMLHSWREQRRARNSGACMLYGSPCKFLGICSGYDTPDSANWRRKEQVHTELPIIDSDGRDVLTNSRIRCFQTCRRKHHFEYDLGIERQVEEEREALYFGTAWHKALEVYFLTQKEHYQNGNTDEQQIPAGIEFARNAATSTTANPTG